MFYKEMSKGDSRAEVSAESESGPFAIRLVTNLRYGRADVMATEEAATLSEAQEKASALLQWAYERVYGKEAPLPETDEGVKEMLRKAILNPREGEEICAKYQELRNAGATIPDAYSAALNDPEIDAKWGFSNTQQNEAS